MNLDVLPSKKLAIVFYQTKGNFHILPKLMLACQNNRLHIR